MLLVCVRLVVWLSFCRSHRYKWPGNRSSGSYKQLLVCLLVFFPLKLVSKRRKVKMGLFATRMCYGFGGAPYVRYSDFPVCELLELSFGLV